jgi:hypothetical protein
VRPLRPGPRINLARGRPGQTTTTTEEPAVEDHVTGDEEQPSNAETSEEKVRKKLYLTKFSFHNIFVFRSQKLRLLQ